MPNPPPTKARLRSALRQRRQALGAVRQHDAARALCQNVCDLPFWSRAQRIALYLSADGEIDTDPLCQLARQGLKEVFLPVIQHDNSLLFAPWHAQDNLMPNRYGIPEPPAQIPRHRASDLDILFLPLVGWDRKGRRLGMGGGFYDRTLATGNRPVLVGLAHAIQEVEQIPGDDWDVPLDFIATDSTLHHFQGTT